MCYLARGATECGLGHRRLASPCPKIETLSLVIRTSALTFEPVVGTHSRALLSAYGQQLRPGCPPPTSLPPPSSLNQLVSPHHERLGDGQPQRLRRLEVDDQLVLRRLLDREVSRLRALEDLVRVDREPPVALD